jgi:hypothetical protein
VVESFLTTALIRKHKQGLGSLLKMLSNDGYLSLIHLKNMATSSSYETNDMYLMSILSLSCLILFIVVKFNAPWSKEIYLLCMVGVWMAFQLTALILFSLQHSQRVELPQQLATSINNILATTSLWGVAVIQVSQSL